MSLIIFFGMAFCIFMAGMILISLTFYHWYKLRKDAKSQKANLS